jgi:hypothetical protein
VSRSLLLCLVRFNAGERQAVGRLAHVNIDDDLFDAWADETPPERQSITSHSCLECDDIARVFSGTKWSELADVEFLRYNRESLTLFAPPAFHYYQPAFMRATLSDPIGADLIPDVITWNVQRELGNEPRGWLPLFTPKQRNLLARFLRMLPALGIVEEDEIGSLPEMLEA